MKKAIYIIIGAIGAITMIVVLLFGSDDIKTKYHKWMKSL